MTERATGRELPDPSHLRDMIVADVMSRWPATVRTFHSLGMACPGCVMAPFMTVAEAAEAYGRDPVRLAEALRRTDAAVGQEKQDDERA